jgi:hypothetical protein
MYHEWGDEDFDWDSLYKAERFIWIWLKRLTGAHLMLKEKYGTLRYSFMFGSSKIESIKNIQIRLGNCLFPFIIFIACWRWPNVAQEILNDLLPNRGKPLPWFARPFVKVSPWRSMEDTDD